MSRLIDADALIDSIMQYANEPVKLNDKRWNTRCTAIIEDMIGTVKLQPDVDAKLVKHGYWEPGFLAWVCSNCGYDVSIDRPQYCPDCGARMDGERREGYES